MVLNTLKSWAKEIKQQTLTVYYAARDPRSPLWVRLFALFIVAYAISPIDLIPDFIPVLGYLDDLLIVPLGLMLIIKFTPNIVLQDAKALAEQSIERPVSYIAAFCIGIIWLVLIGWCIHRFFFK
ncbi:MAG: DUF1232 domain-containing protein [Gammaproteobacteria bacterium]|jgi:uncharacterized membrane protein YkvA (DUF1232 family)|nr:DUF1232 domain-containing protein [Gammaproteobacteria bacterium]